MTRGLWLGAEAILRSGSAASAAPSEGNPGRKAFAYFLVCASLYGALMGTFGGFAGDRALLILYAALKVPLLLLVTGAVCLPSFFVLNTLFGVREDFPEVMRALALTQAGFAVILLSLSPYTLFWYVAFSDYDAATLFNAVIFGVASFGAQWLLAHHYRRLFRRNSRHRLLHRIWLVLFAFVGIQTAWVLRPFVGHPNMPAQFFRAEAWENAYVELARKVGSLAYSSTTPAN